MFKSICTLTGGTEKEGARHISHIIRIIISSEGHTEGTRDGDASSTDCYISNILVRRGINHPRFY